MVQYCTTAVKVVRTVLQDAASVAGLLVTTEAMIAEAPKKDAAPTGMPGGGGMAAWAAWISKPILGLDPGVSQPRYGNAKRAAEMPPFFVSQRVQAATMSIDISPRADRV